MGLKFNPLLFMGLDNSGSGGGGGGTVTNVTGSGNITSSGGTTPNITFTGTLPIANGGTGQTMANTALNAFLPTQTSNSGKFLTTNGTDSSWASVSAANTALSNLASTAINADLIPNADATIRLGNTSLGKDFLSLAVHNIGSSIGDPTSVDVRNRNLYDNSGNTALDWSGSISDPVKLPSNGGNNKGLAFYDTGNTKFVTLIAPASIGTTYTMSWPTNQGAAGTVLINNGSGVLSWSVPNVSSYSARAHGSSTTISGTLATIVYATEDYDSGNNYDNTTGIFTAPFDGIYQVNASLLFAGTIALNNTVIMEIQKNGSVYSRRTVYLPAALTDGSIAISDSINCSATDTIRIQVSTNSTSPTIVASNFDNYLSIVKV